MRQAVVMATNLLHFLRRMLRLHHSLMSRDNGRRSTFRNKFHVASHGDSHDSTPLLFMINSS